MKKFLQIITLLFSLTVLGFTPVMVNAQSEDVIQVEDELPATAAPTPAAPNTGIAPTENNVLQNAAVFIGGSLLGAGLGLSVLNMRKKRLN